MGRNIKSAVKAEQASLELHPGTHRTNHPPIVLISLTSGSHVMDRDPSPDF